MFKGGSDSTVFRALNLCSSKEAGSNLARGISIFFLPTNFLLAAKITPNSDGKIMQNQFVYNLYVAYIVIIGMHFDTFSPICT